MISCPFKNKDQALCLSHRRERREALAAGMPKVYAPWGPCDSCGLVIEIIKEKSAANSTEPSIHDRRKSSGTQGRASGKDAPHRHIFTAEDRAKRYRCVGQHVHHERHGRVVLDPKECPVCGYHYYKQCQRCSRGRREI